MLNEWIRADHALFFFLNGMAAAKPVAALALELSMLGRYPILFMAGLVLALDGWPVFRRHLLGLLLVAPLAFGLNAGLKQAVNRPRPLGYYAGAVARGEVTIQALEPIRKRAFPSGHTTLAFFALGYLAWARRKHAVWALILAAGVGWSRVAVGAHFPLDCLAGALLGLGWSWLAWRVNRYLEHGTWTRRDARTMPAGPSSGSCSAC